MTNENVCVFNQLQVLKVKKTNNLEEAIKFLYDQEYGQQEEKEIRGFGFNGKEDGITFYEEEELEQIGVATKKGRLVKLNAEQETLCKAINTWPRYIRYCYFRLDKEGGYGSEFENLAYVAYGNDRAYLMSEASYKQQFKEIDNIDELKVNKENKINLNDYEVKLVLMV